MAKYVAMIIGLLVLLTSVASPQEVVITDFPLGVGSSVGQEFFKPYFAQLKAIADTLNKYPLTLAVVTGGADGGRYRENNDAKNPGLALGRAHALRNALISEFDVDSARIIIQSKDAEARGARYRYAGVRVVWDLSSLEARLDALENRPPVEKHFTEVQHVSNNIADQWGLRFGVGASSSPFGAVLVATGALTWKRMVYVETVVGYTFWNRTFRFEDTDLNTRNRLIGGQVIVYPSRRLPVGILGGWFRFEQIAQRFYEYVRMSEGAVIGLQITPLEFLSITGAYKPAKQRVSGSDMSQSKYGQFMVAVTVHKTFGGAK